MFYKLEIYVPAAAADRVKAAVTAAGAGRLGNYDSCIWETAGTGQFRPLAGSRPYLGTAGNVECVPEIKLETMCAAAELRAVIAALRDSHPYETPAFYFWPVELEVK